MAADATSLHCPNCGAPAAPDDSSCQYCHAPLATVACPSCFALMFQGSAYCPVCGARRARTDGGPAQAPCPSCRGVMREARLGDATLLGCAGCGGMWIDTATFEHICADREAQAAVFNLAAPLRPSAAGEVKYRPCVACGKLMNRLNFGRLSGTIVDVCKGHGTFLDAGELHQIVTFIHHGGLDRARQRQIDEMKEEMDRLRALQAGADPSHPNLHVETSTRTWTGVDLLTLLEGLRRE